jgi:hypothetical protein
MQNQAWCFGKVTAVPAYPGLSLLISAYLCLSLLIAAYLCLSLLISAYPYLSLPVPAYLCWYLLAWPFRYYGSCHCGHCH